VKWQAFVHDGTTYDLTHLHPHTLQFERPAQEKKPAVVFNVDVIFGLHCFSREIPTDTYNHALVYSDARESRLFDFERYDLSKQLPAIIESLSQRKCFQTDRSDFVTVDVIGADATIVNYHVYFTVSKATKKGHMNLFVSSAYVANRRVGSSGRAIKFLVILHNTMNKILIKA
jgi:hypothetical protein